MAHRRSRDRTRKPRRRTTNVYRRRIYRPPDPTRHSPRDRNGSTATGAVRRFRKMPAALDSWRHCFLNSLERLRNPIRRPRFDSNIGLINYHLANENIRFHIAVIFVPQRHYAILTRLNINLTTTVDKQTSQPPVNNR
uniref:Uncharacterized protein n=1 Tax=Romanomermis culicivorax TaxID=13658 RepID=A0A915I5H4_ROMCU